jgi:hypothetical protein
MQWALVATTEQELSYWALNEDPTQPANWVTITAEPGTIVNLIVYDGVSPYSPPDNTALMQVPDNAQIGDTGYTPS